MRFEIDGIKYDSRKMDAFTQMGIVARISPLLASGFGELAPIVLDLKAKGQSFADIPMERLLEIATPVARELAKLSDEDRLYVVGACLSVCQRQNDNGQGWAPVWNREAKRAMFKDVNENLGTMMKIVLAVLQDNLAPFLPASLSALIGVART